MARPSLVTSYIDLQKTFLMRMNGFSEAEAERHIKEISHGRYKPKTVIHVKQVRYGQTEIVAEELGMFHEHHRSSIISPSGSLYKPHTEQIGVVTQLTNDLKTNRGKHKKAMLKAKAVGDEATEAVHYSAQTTIKITMNSLPGGMGSPYNAFYDKGNYNAITSSARALIAQAYTTAETTLGGNFAWFSEDELINHIIIHLTDGIDVKKINRLMNQHHLQWISKEQLMEFYHHEYNKYHLNEKLEVVEKLVGTMCPEEVAFFWYFQNLRHLVWGNEIFKTWIDDMFDLTKIELDEDAVPNDLFEIDKDLVSVISVGFNDVFKTEDDLQVYDFPTKRPDLAKKFVSIGKYVQRMFDGVQELFDTFIYTNLNTPRIDLKKNMNRNTVILSDTDSVIFTAKDWVEWYTGDYFKLTAKTYQISSVAIYWLTKAITHCLKKYSIAHGATGKFIYVMEMKNEFLYPTMIIYDIKKTYAGQVKVQEGVILPELQTDIKGVQLRGSDVCNTSLKFIESFLVDDILGKSFGKISAAPLIAKVVAFEQRIRKSVQDGETEFLKQLSVKMEKDYANPLSSNYYYYLAWQEIFAPDYGDIQVPTKTPIAFLLPVSSQYLNYLMDTNKKIYKRANEFMAKYKRHPASICINPQIDRMPKELIPLIDIKSVIHHNIKALYLTLKQLGIAVGFEDKKLLLSDVYGVDGIALSMKPATTNIDHKDWMLRRAVELRRLIQNAPEVMVAMYKRELEQIERLINV